MFLKLGCVGLTFWLIAEGFSEMKRAWLVVIFLAMGGFVACKDSVQDSVWQKKFAELSENHISLQKENKALKEKIENLKSWEQEREEHLSKCFKFQDAIREYHQKIDAKSCKDLASCRKIFEIEMAYLKHSNDLYLEMAVEYTNYSALVSSFLKDCTNPPQGKACTRQLQKIWDITPLSNEE